MYTRIRFDRQETVEKPGEKLFPRIKDVDEQRKIRALPAQR